MAVWRMIGTAGGASSGRTIDWSGLPLAVELLGVQDVEGLILRLVAIKQYRSPQERGPLEE